MASKKLIVANWKMNPLTVRDAVKLARASDRAGVVVCPPFPFLAAVRGVLSRAFLGAQDAFWEERGAFTGEVSPIQLRRLGVRYIIAGHSERRRVFGETDAMVANKVAACVREGLIPILCVGETKEERAAGKTRRVVQRQLKVGLSLNPKPYPPAGRAGTLNPIVIAYEPVWAIGTGMADDPRETVAVIAYIRSVLRSPRLPVLYGGSVNMGNAESFLVNREISGALVGGASLRTKEFNAIVRIARKL